MLPDGVMGDALIHVQEALARGDDARGFAAARGLDKSVSGYVLHTVPVCLFCWLRYREDYRRGIESVVCLGGDTDTTAAIVGGLIGASLGPAQIPAEWLDRLIEWPRTRNWMIKLGDRLSAVAQGELARPLPLFWPGLVLRNLVFLPIVLAHGFRRCLPPY